MLSEHGCRCHWRQWWVKQELLEVADQGLHCLAWQSSSNAAKVGTDEEIDVLLDADVELQDQQPKLEEEDRLFKVQPLEVEAEEEKFFIVQSLEDKETDQDRVTALMDSSDYEDITDVFRDIEIEDLEAEKENVVGGNNVTTDVEKFVRDNNSSLLVSKKKKLQETSKVDSCLEAYEEITI